MLLFKILNLCCNGSKQVCATVLKNGFINVIVRWMTRKDKNSLEDLDKAFHNDSSDASDLEEFKIGKLIYSNNGLNL